MRSINVQTSEPRLAVDALFPVYRVRIPDSGGLNRRLSAAFQRVLNEPSTRRSHLFHGRYENIYPDRRQLPEIETLIGQVESAAAEILDYSAPLRTGFWFNRMAPGDVTTLHSHDDDDELLSAVYYLEVPPSSGRLVFRRGQSALQVSPEAGLMLLFPPNLPHEVEVHRGDGIRLSVAFNTGPGG